MAKKKQRETYGNGSITPKVGKDGKQMTDKDGKPLWLVCLSFGSETITDENGKQRKKRRKVQRVAHGTLAEARKLARQLNDQYESIDVSASKEKTFDDACRAWETSLRNAATASEGAMNGYLQNLGHMSEKIGGKVLTAITRQDVEDALSSIKAERGISNTTLHKVYAVTKRVFKYAVNIDWLVRNPCDKIQAPKIDEVVNRRSLSAEECARFRACIDQAEDEAFSEFEAKEGRAAKWGNTFGRKLVRGLSGMSCLMAIRIELATGLRRSEVLGLTWSAVDFERGQIFVHQKLVEEKRRGSDKPMELKVGTPKTKMGTRAVSVDDETMEHLKRWKDVQAKAMHLVMPEGKALTQTQDTPVCIGDRGGWMRPASISRWWDGYEQKSRKKGDEGRKYHRVGFRELIGFPDLCMHELRHTQATQLLGAGVDLKTVQARMGHAKASHTLDLYAHAIPANDRDAANIMSAIYNSPSKPSATIIPVGKTA